jgi:hypothetical protein
MRQTRSPFVKPRVVPVGKQGALICLDTHSPEPMEAAFQHDLQPG